MNKTFSAILVLCLIGSSVAFQVDMEVCFTQAALFTHTVKNVIAVAGTSPVGVSELLNAVYESSEELNPFLNSCGIDIPLVDKFESKKPADATSCFSDVEEVITIAKELKDSAANKEITSNLSSLLPKIIQLFKVTKQLKADCELVPSSQTLLGSSDLQTVNILQCLVEANITATNAKQFIKDANENLLPMETLFEEGINVYNEIVVLTRDCGLSKKLSTIDNVNELKLCVSNLKGFASSFEPLLKIVQANEYGTLITTAQDVHNQIIAATSGCNKGLQESVGKNVLQCLKLTVALKNNIATLQTEYQEKDIPDLVVTGYTILEGLQAVLNACQDDPKDLHIPQFTVSNLKGCVVDTEGLLTSFSTIGADLKEKNFVQLFKDAQVAVTEYKTLQADCQVTPARSLQESVGKNVLQCLKLTVALKNNISALQSEYQQKDIPDLVVTGYTILEGLQAYVNACQDDPKDLHIPQFTVSNLKQCVVDSEGLLTSFSAMGADLKAKNFVQLFLDAHDAIEIYRTIETDCQATPALALQQSVGKNVLQCLKLTVALKNNIATLQTEYQEKDIPDLVVTGYTILEGLQAVLNACQDDPKDLHIPQFTVSNLKGCVVDTEGLLTDFSAIGTDLKEKNYIQLFNDAQATIAQYKTIQSDCQVTPAPALLESVGKNVLVCLKLTVALKQNIQTLQTQFQQNDIPDLVVTGYTILEGLQAFVNACQDTPQDLHIPQITFTNLHECVVNGEAIVVDAKNLYADIKAKNWSNVLLDVQASVASYQAIKTDCAYTPVTSDKFLADE